VTVFLQWLAPNYYFYNNGNMKTKDAVPMLAALAQDTRLAIFRLLVEAGREGMSAGVIAEKLKLPAATLSFHIAQLTRAKLVVARPESRFIYYAANYKTMDSLIAFLTDNCCQGDEVCLPKTTAISTSKKSRKAA
jgi:ArsR family transcriptional regulator, arsenate/arsenite/antimonite-responsive transcriptional repressor